LLRACPICLNTSKGYVLHTQSFALPEGHLLSGARKYDVVSCSKCGFVYADTPVKQDAYDKYYTEMSKYEMGYDNIDLEKYMCCQQIEMSSFVAHDLYAFTIWNIWLKLTRP